MRITRWPKSYEIKDAFPAAREILLVEGACVYAAEKADKYFVIVDSRASLGFFDGEEREDLAGEIVAVYEFATEEDRAEYLLAKGAVIQRASHAD